MIVIREQVESTWFKRMTNMLINHLNTSALTTGKPNFFSIYSVTLTYIYVVSSFFIPPANDVYPKRFNCMQGSRKAYAISSHE